MEYAKINYNITAPQNPVPVSSVEKPAKSDKGRFSSQANSYIPCRGNAGPLKLNFIENTRNGPGNNV